MMPTLRCCALVCGVVAALAGCASAPVPDLTYYRMPARVETAPITATAPRFALPIIVDALVADGVYNDLSMLYANQPEGSIRAYHYQLWENSPGLLLQRRLIQFLRARNAAALVTDRLPPSLDSRRIFGRVDSFERVHAATGWSARVRLELRVEQGARMPPLLVNDYAATVAADGDGMRASVRAFAAAIDQVFDAFWVDLGELPP